MRVQISPPVPRIDGELTMSELTKDGFDFMPCKKGDFMPYKEDFIEEVRITYGSKIAEICDRKLLELGPTDDVNELDILASAKAEAGFKSNSAFYSMIIGDNSVVPNYTEFEMNVLLLKGIVKRIKNKMTLILKKCFSKRK